MTATTSTGRTCTNCGATLIQPLSATFLRPTLPALPDLIRRLLTMGVWALYATPCRQKPYLLATDFDTFYEVSESGDTGLPGAPIKGLALGDICITNAVLPVVG